MKYAIEHYEPWICESCRNEEKVFICFSKKNVNYSFLPGGWFTFSILISLIPKISMQKFANSANVATELPMGLSFKRVFSYILPSTYNKVSFISMNLFLSSSKNKSLFEINCCCR